MKRVHLRSATVWLTVLATGALALGVLGATLLRPEPAAAQGTAQPIAVEMGERGAQYYFAPNELTVPAGATRFTFRNNGARRHNFVIETLNMRTPDVDAGASYEATFTFANPGTYDYICDLPTHAARGMTGRIVVTAAGAAPAPAAPAAQATAPAAPGAPTSAAPAAQATAPAAQATRPAQTTPGATGATGATGAGSAGSASGQGAGQGVSPGGLPLFVSLAIHIPAAISWLGVVLYQAVVGAVPSLTVAQRADLLRRPRWLIVAVIPLFFITGTYQTIFNPFVTLTSFETAEAFRATSPYAQALFWKHGFVLLSMALTLTVTFWLAPRLARAATATAPTAAGPAAAGSVAVSGEGAPDPAAGRVSLLAWANVAACLALLLCVSVMVFQLH